MFLHVEEWTLLQVEESEHSYKWKRVNILTGEREWTHLQGEASEHSYRW